MVVCQLGAQEETGIYWNAVEDRGAIQRNIRRGRWDLVVPALARLRLNQELVTDIYEQVGHRSIVSLRCCCNRLPDCRDHGSCAWISRR